MSPLLETGETCWRVSACSDAGLLIDARDYYRAFYRAALTATRRIALVGWQFDSTVALLRGEDAAGAEHPLELLEFLDSLCRRRPELEVLILAWDYNPVFAFEREWLQRAVFGIGTASNLRFEFDARHPPGASHHQKFVVIDSGIAFAGGIDFAGSRWDDRAHRSENPLRADHGSPGKPYHDVMACVRGPAVRDLEWLFIERWQTATGERLTPVQEGASAKELEATVPIAAVQVALCRTLRSESALVPEVLRLHERAILEAERLIYIETQYFTAVSIRDALIARMRRSPLSVVLVMPLGADTPKERLVLGAAQERLLMSLSLEARRLGSELRLFSTVAAGPENPRRPTFIHSKVLIVDDRLLAIGSANLTNRSLMLDSELTLAFEQSPGCRPGAFEASLVRVRSELLAEHAGVAPDPRFFSVDGLVPRLDAIVESGRTRLVVRNVDQALANSSPILKLEQLFDPGKPLGEMELGELIAFDQDEFLSGTTASEAGEPARSDRALG